MYQSHQRAFKTDPTTSIAPPLALAPRSREIYKSILATNQTAFLGPQESTCTYLPSASPKRTCVLFVDHTASLSGGELALLNLITHLDQTRIQPIVLLFSEGPLAERLRNLGVETHILPLASQVLKSKKDSLGLKSFLRLSMLLRAGTHVLRVARFIRKLNVDLVHTNSLKADIIGGLAGRFAGRKVIWHVRDRIDADYLPVRVVSIFRFLCRTLPDFVITNSQATLNTLHLPTYSPKKSNGRTVGNASVVHSGTICPSRPSFPDEYGKAPLIGLVGRISPWKGQHVFLQAVALIRQQFPNARFQIIGAPLFAEQDYERKVRSLANELGINDIVEFTGFRTDVSQLVAKLDILVHASTLAEPFGQVVIEGMAAGKPVVATDGGGILEIVEDGVTGILVPMGEAAPMASAVMRLLGDRRLLRQMGELARERVIERFTIQQTARKVGQIYNSLRCSRPIVKNSPAQLSLNRINIGQI